MRASLRGILITAVIAFLAGFGGIWLGMSYFGHASRQPALHDVIHQQLGLSADQQRQIATIEADFATRRSALELEMRAANGELAAAIREEHGYGPRVTAAIERFHAAMGQLQTEMIQHVFAMRAVMTPEQKAKFDDTVVSALTADPQ